MSGDLLALGTIGALALAGVTRRGSRSQAPAKYVVLATTGDVNPTEHGGGWVYRHPQGHLLWVSIRGLDHDGLAHWASEAGYDAHDQAVVQAAYPMEVSVVHVPDPAEVAALIDVQVAEHASGWFVDWQDRAEWLAAIRAGNPQTVVSALEHYSTYYGMQNLDPFVYEATILELYQQFPHLRGAVLRPTLAGVRWVLGDSDPYHETLEELEELRQELIQDDGLYGPARQLELDQIRRLGALLDRYERPLLLGGPE